MAWTRQRFARFRFEARKPCGSDTLVRPTLRKALVQFQIPLSAMAHIEPFRALRYDPTRVSIPQVVTQPYDKITPQMQDGYYAASPQNLVRIILGEAEPADDTEKNVYSRAAANFREWRSSGVLRRDPEPAIYAYQQHFKVPGDHSGMRHM